MSDFPIIFWRYRSPEYQMLHDHITDPPNGVRISDSLMDAVKIVPGANQDNDASDTSNSKSGSSDLR